MPFVFWLGTWIPHIGQTDEWWSGKHTRISIGY